jgi:hypothetical protein
VASEWPYSVKNAPIYDIVLITLTDDSLVFDGPEVHLFADTATLVLLVLFGVLDKRVFNKEAS